MANVRDYARSVSGIEIKTGTKIMIDRPVSPSENGWDRKWTVGMNGLIGNKYQAEVIEKDNCRFVNIRTSTGKTHSIPGFIALVTD